MCEVLDCIQVESPPIPLGVHVPLQILLAILHLPLDQHGSSLRAHLKA